MFRINYDYVLRDLIEYMSLKQCYMKSRRLKKLSSTYRRSDEYNIANLIRKYNKLLLKNSLRQKTLSKLEI